MRESEIEIIGVVGNGYYRFLPSGLNINRLDEYLPKLFAASREIVRHYQGKIWMWQLENEPDWWLEHFASDWRRGGIWFEQDAVDLILGGLHEIVKEEDPRALSMVNLEADTARAFAKSYSRYCDVLGLDFYPSYTNPENINVTKLKEKIVEARRVSGHDEIIVAETGYPSGPRIFGFGATKQAEYVRAVCDEAYSIDSLSVFGMWRLSDPYWLSFPYQENSFGLIDRQGIPKKAWFEFLAQVRVKK
jgi:hypothetical protein